MDFCAGIGGGRLGLEACGLTCVAHSEIDDSPNQTYRMFFGKEEKNYGDLMDINTSELPDFDVLIGGFPCQTFSIVGKRTGFEDNRGLIIYGLIKILKEKKIPYFILENVKGLTNHNKGQTLKTILDTLDEAGYIVEHKILNSMDFGVPQMRERIYLVGIKRELHKKRFQWSQPLNLPDIKEYLININNEILPIDDVTFQKYLNNQYNKGKYNIKDILKRDYLVLDWRQSDLRLYEDKCPTLRKGRHGILYVKSKQLFKLSGIEALLLQGFPRELALKTQNAKITNNKLLSQAGNAMTVNVIEVIGKELINCI
jgi:DNA (cytosine-5)-methyltransferase 1